MTPDTLANMASLDTACQTGKYASGGEIPGLDISEESMDRLEVGCGYCGRPIRIRSLADHILAIHSNIA
ncbi:MAG: hypothetical protein WAO91_08455 [Candidatus Nitrosotenuis sp.]